MEDNKIMEGLTPEEKERLGINIDEPAKKKNSLQASKKALMESIGEEDNRENSIVPKSEINSVNIQELLSKVKIDVNNVEFTDKAPMEQFSEMEFLMNGKSTFETVCNQSCYVAHMESLKYTDLSAFEGSTGDIYTEKSRLFKTIYEKINTTSLGAIDYKTWLKVTSLYDIPSLVFGIYNQTFKTETDFEIVCKNCKQKFSIKVGNKDLITIKNEEIYRDIKNILTNIRKPEEALRESVVNKNSRHVLEESKIMIDIQTPSLYDYLEILSSIDRSKIEDLKDAVGILIFIKNLYRIDLAELVKGKVKYYPITNRAELIKIIKSLELSDAQQLGELIQERLDKYSVDYAIKDFNCPHCDQPVGEIPVDMENLLFFRIKQM